jgi:phthalate 4,5-dioxygenase
MAIQESVGPIVDRSAEHLGSSDTAVIATRRLLLGVARDVAAGREPPGLDGSSYGVRAAEGVLPPGAAWHEAMRDELAARW